MQRVDTALAAADREAPGAKAHLARIGLQQVGRNCARFRQHHLHRQVQRTAAHMHRAGAAVLVAAFDCSGVGLDKMKCRELQPQQIGGDLYKAGLVALACRSRALWPACASVMRSAMQG